MKRNSRTTAPKFVAKIAASPIAQLILVPLLCLCPVSATAQHPNAGPDATNRTLDSGWQFRSLATPKPSQKVDWQSAVVPGVVQTDLLRHKLIPEPFYGDDDTHLQWIGLSDWEYHTTFTPTSHELTQAHQEFHFEGLDTFADIILNGETLLQTDNMFRTWRIPIQGKLHPGPNELRIVFHSPVTKMIPIVKAKAIQLPTVGQVQRVSEENIATDPYVRKSPYHYGWDWGPRYVTEGIWKPAHLETWSGAQILDTHIQQRHVDSASADLDAQLEVESSKLERAIVRVQYRPLDRPSATPILALQMPVSLSAGSNMLSLPFSIRKPKLWFPTGYGAQSRYLFTFTLSTNSGTVLYRELRTGLRSIELRRQSDQWGKSFTFVVNGIPIFAKGAAVIPFDSFPTRVTAARHREILQAAHDSNMNMVRAWGGGYYESDDFYELCDSLGLMVWQDFMFGGAFVPGDEAFQKSVEQEAIDNVTRLRDHPSIVIWCGNNETEYFLGGWNKRQREKNKIPQDDRERVTHDYSMLFDGILKRVILEKATPVPYWASSPSSGYDLPTDANRNGDAHYWDVWHGTAPVSDYLKQTPRFMSEFGFISFPNLETIRSFIPPDQMQFNSPIMEDHQKSEGGNEKVQMYLARDYGEARDFASFVYLSQVQQAEAIKVGAEQLRRSRPRTMGSLFWQLNDCWPTISWSSIDFFGRWKALQFYARRFYAPVLVSPLRHDGKLDIYAVSDLQQPKSLTLNLRLMSVEGNEIARRTQQVELPPLSSHILLTLDEKELLGTHDPRTLFYTMELSESQVSVASNLAFLVPMKQLALTNPNLHAEWLQAPGKLQLRLTASALARNVQVSFGEDAAELSNNFVDVLPGQPLVLNVTSTTSPEVLRSHMKLTSLVDALKSSP
ncbi:MAG TPA: glycoside hydrolase family 2 protein [Acidobacteriaceae bacterium]